MVRTHRSKGGRLALIFMIKIVSPSIHDSGLTIFFGFSYSGILTGSSKTSPPETLMKMPQIRSTYISPPPRQSDFHHGFWINSYPPSGLKASPQKIRPYALMYGRDSPAIVIIPYVFLFVNIYFFFRMAFA